MITIPEEDVPVLTHMRNSAKSLVEILIEHAVSGRNMGCEDALSLFTATQEMNDEERNSYVFDHIVGAYDVIKGVVRYDYNQTLH